MIDIITYNDKTVQALYDAVLYNAIQGDGVLQGLNIDLQPQGSSITIENGYGLIQGRVFKIENEEVAVDMPVSETAGQIIIKIDLSSTEEPISVFSDNTMRPLQQDTNFNVLNGIYEVQFATYRVSGTGITNVVQKFERVIPADEVYSDLNVFKTNATNSINTINNKINTYTNGLTIRNFAKTNVTINANSSTTSEVTIKLNAGERLVGYVDKWIDSTGTTGGANQSSCVCVNWWGSGTTRTVSVRNFATSQAKVTVNISALIAKVV